MDNHVLILGAGASGLMGARLLAQSGVAVTLIEARSRVGGRILTERAGVGFPAELGAEFIHGRRSVTWDLVEAAGLRTHEVPDDHWRPGAGGRLMPDPGFWDRLEQVTSRFHSVNRDLDFASFLRSQAGLDPQACALASSYVEGFHAADLDRVSVQSLARSEEASEQDDGTRQFRITEGYSALAEWLLRELPREHANLRLNSRVTAIRWQPGNVRVHIETDSGDEVLAARCALVTLPLGVLKSGSPQFAPPLPGKEDAMRRLASGAVAKITLLFKQQFWHKANFGFVHCPELPFQTWWADQRGLALTGWCGGLPAKRLLATGPEGMLQEATRCLSRIFHVTEREVVDLIASHHSHDWIDDPFARGAYSYVPVGGLDAPDQLAAPVETTLFFAGEATVSDGRNGTVHGALASGLRAAGEIIKALERRILTSA